MNYTKGEWKVLGPTPFSPSPRITCGHVEVAFCPQAKCAVTDKEVDAHDTLSNAHLIAAAPALHDAALIALALVNTVLCEHPDDAIAQEQKRIIEAALDKADGK